MRAYKGLWASDYVSLSLCETVRMLYDGVSKSFRTDDNEINAFAFGITRWEATQKVMAAKLTRLTHKIAIKLHLVAESCTICSSRSRRPVRKLLDTPAYYLCINTRGAECENREWGKLIEMFTAFKQKRDPHGSTDNTHFLIAPWNLKCIEILRLHDFWSRLFELKTVIPLVQRHIRLWNVSPTDKTNKINVRTRLLHVNNLI
jgi:hypothetical protein